MAERAVATKPTADAAARKSLSSRVRAPGDAYEREADRAADGVMSGRGETRPLRPLPRLLSTMGDPVAGYGRGLPDSTRAYMESRYGYDFRGVRVHSDERAAASAKAIGAAAYTSGSSVVFDANSYNPHSPSGRRLLAHELAHVVQQSHTAALTNGIQRQPATASAASPATPTVTGKWYQEAIDQYQADKQRLDEAAKRGEFILTPPYYETKKALIELCEAVDRKDNAAVPKKLDALMKAGLWVHLQILSRDLLNELTARMYEMGLDTETQNLRKAYSEGEKVGPYEGDIYAARRTINFLARLVAGANADAKVDSPAAVATSMHQFVRAFNAVRAEYLKIDKKAVDEERRFGMGRFVLRPLMSREEYYLAVVEQIEFWQRSLSTFQQNAMDAARRDLESKNPTGSGAALLQALHDAMTGELDGALFPKDASQNIAGATFQITHTEMGKGKGTISDEFAKGKDARKLPVNTYDPDQEFVRELQASLAQFFNVRIDQLDVLGRVYGVVGVLNTDKLKDDQIKAKQDKAKDNAETIRRMSGGQFRLDSDDDWRAFLLQKYRDLTNPPSTLIPGQKVPAPSGPEDSQAPAPTAKKALTPTEAMGEIIDLLFAYLKAFTVHARFTNIYDVGDVAYLNRPFPRALTGQAVHDCGVYALRVAYMLSLIRQELNLRFRFVVLPVHVSLVITGDKLPAYIVENNSVNEIPASDLEEKRQAWEKVKDPNAKAGASGKTDEEQFIGEMAATDFIHGPIDMPFKVTDVPASVKDAKAEQRQLWAYYQQTATAGLFGPSAQNKNSPNYQFQLRYLALTEQGREVYNKYFLQFWNEDAPAAWEKLLAKLTGQPPNHIVGAPPQPVTVADVISQLAVYTTNYDAAVAAVKVGYDSMEKDMRTISQDLRADPGLAKAGVRLSYGPRANMFWSYYWQLHSTELTKYKTTLAGRGGTEEESSDAVSKALNPPWIPKDEKKLEALD